MDEATREGTLRKRTKRAPRRRPSPRWAVGVLFATQAMTQAAQHDTSAYSVRTRPRDLEKRDEVLVARQGSPA